MDLNKLEALSTEALSAIRDKCAEVLRTRSEVALRHGAIGWFLDGGGKRHFMRVDRINTKTISGVEVDATDHSIAFKNKWKVSPNLLTIVGTGPKPKPVVRPAYVPQSTVDAQW